MVNNRGYIIHKARKKKGRRHDYDVYKKNHSVPPPQLLMCLPLLGVKWISQNNYPHYHTERRDLALSQEEKEYNKIHSRKRIVIEHTICKLKKYR